MYKTKTAIAGMLVWLGFALSAHAASAATTSSLSQYGIGWNFTSPVEYGQFANGDYWVLDNGSGVSISSITPGYYVQASTSRAMNGSMIDPSTATQGYDSNGSYSSSLNVGIGISQANPLIIRGNHSLVSTISYDQPGVQNPSYVKTAAVLTVLTSIPPAGTFRPGISGTAKRMFNKSSLDYSLLLRLPVPSVLKVSTTTFNTYANYLQMVWLDHNGSWTSRAMHPADGMPSNYYYAPYMADAALMLHMDFSNAEKERLLVNFIQLGLDLYSYLESGANGWPPDGGHSNGRKWPILFAGLMLHDQAMGSIGSVSGNYLYANGYGPGNFPPGYKHFGEDGQTFYVRQSDVDLTNGSTWKPDVRTAPNFPYTASMIGMPEWGIRYSTNPNYSDSSWSANYRTIMSAMPSWVGFAIAAYAMNAKDKWNNPAFFDYVDRYMSISKDGTDPFGYAVDRQVAGSRPGWMGSAMYDAYRWQLSPATCSDRMKDGNETGIDSGGSCSVTFPRSDVDHNGSISSSDALLTLRKSLGLSMAGTAWYESASTGDVDCNGSVTGSDALLILRKSLGLSMTGTAWCG